MFYYNDTTYLNEETIRQVDSGAFYLYAFLHEVTHAFTIDLVVKGKQTTVKDGKRVTQDIIDKELRQKNTELTNLFKEAKNLDKKSESPKQDLYGFTDEFEFVAEIFTNPDFANHVKSLRAPQESKSIWQKFIDWLTSIFYEVPKKGRGEEIYEESMELINAIVENVTKDYRETIQREREQIESQRELREAEDEQLSEGDKWLRDNQNYIVEEIYQNGPSITNYLYGIKTANGTSTRDIMTQQEWDTLSPEEKYNVIKCN